jgi:hypothetical protein
MFKECQMCRNMALGPGRRHSKNPLRHRRHRRPLTSQAVPKTFDSSLVIGPTYIALLLLFFLHELGTSHCRR